MKKFNLIIIGIIFIAAGILFFFLISEERRGGVYLPASSVATATPPIINQSRPTETPTTSAILTSSQEELKNLWLNGKRCPSSLFSLREKDLAKLDFGQFLIDAIEVHFTDNATCEDAERIALLLKAKISGFDSFSNQYEFQVSTHTTRELEEVIAKVKAFNDPKIRFVSKVTRYDFRE